MEISGLLCGELNGDVHAEQFVTWLNALNAEAWRELKQTFPKRGVALMHDSRNPSVALERVFTASLLERLPNANPQPGDIGLMSGCTAQIRGNMVEVQLTLSHRGRLKRLMEALGRVGFETLECTLSSGKGNESFVWRTGV